MHNRCVSGHQVTMQDYRNEVKEFFSGDEQLASEIEFVLKTAEKEREMLEQMNTCSLAGDAKTPKAQGSVQGSPVRSRPLQPFNFATLQPPRLNFQAARLSLTHCVRRSRKMSSLNRSL